MKMMTILSILFAGLLAVSCGLGENNRTDNRSSNTQNHNKLAEEGFDLSRSPEIGSMACELRNGRTREGSINGVHSWPADFTSSDGLNGFQRCKQTAVDFNRSHTDFYNCDCLKDAAVGRRGTDSNACTGVGDYLGQSRFGNFAWCDRTTTVRRNTKKTFYHWNWAQASGVSYYNGSLLNNFDQIDVEITLGGKGETKKLVSNGPEILLESTEDIITDNKSMAVLGRAINEVAIAKCNGKAHSRSFTAKPQASSGWLRVTVWYICKEIEVEEEEDQECDADETRVEEREYDVGEEPAYYCIPDFS